MTITPRNKPAKTTTPSAAASDVAPSFEDSMRRLGQIVVALESGDLNLEESLAQFEEGVRLARASQSRLDAAEARIEELMRIDENGNPVVRELDADA